MVFGISFKTPVVGQSVAETDRFSRKKQCSSDFPDASKRKGAVPRGAQPLVISNGLLNPNRQAVRNPIPKKDIQALQATFQSFLSHPFLSPSFLKQTEDPNEALRSLVLLGTQLLQHVEDLKADNNLPNTKIIVHSDRDQREGRLARRADIDLLNPVQDQNGLQRITAGMGALLFFAMIYQQPEILTNGLGYLAQEGVKDAQGKLSNHSENLKFDWESLLAKVQNKALPANTLIFSKKERELMAKVAAAQGFDIKTDAGLQAYTQWVVQVLQKTARAIETVGHPYQLSVMGYGWDAHGLLKKTECQDVFQRQE